MEYQRTPRHRSRPARFPNRIREHRLRLERSQRMLARLIGKPLSMVCLWERGHRLPTLPNALRLARALSTLVESLWPDLYGAGRAMVKPAAV